MLGLLRVRHHCIRSLPRHHCIRSLPRHHAALYSTNPMTDDLQKLHSVLHEEGDRSPQLGSDAPVNTTSFNLPQTTFDPFVEGSFLQPRHITMEYRTKGPPFYRKQPRSAGPGAQEARKSDPFYQLHIDPLNECLNGSLLSAFVSEMGKIKGRSENGLTVRNQRRLGKAIRRAKMMGVIPVLSRQKMRWSF